MIKAKKYAIIITVALFLTLVLLAVYRTFFQFKNSLVRQYIQAEAAKFGDPVAATKILHDGVQHILSSRSLTKQVIDYARVSGLEKEKVLVTAALKQAQSFDYLASA